MIKYKGYAVELGGKEFVFPPLSLGSIELLQDKIDDVTKSNMGFKEIGSIIDIALASLKRNYPEITREEVADMIDISNVQTIFLNVMSTSGMVSNNVSKEESELEPKK